MAKVIYVEKHESIEEVCNHLDTTSEKQVILVIPKQASLFASSDQLALLKSTGDSRGQRITIISLDASGLALAEAVGLEVSKPKKSASEGIEHPLLEEKHRIRDSAIKNIWTFGQRRKVSVTTRVWRSVGVMSVLALGGAIFWYVAIARTDIYVKVTPQLFSSNLQIMIDSRVLEDKEAVDQLIIPGRLVTRNLTASERFPSTGKKTFGDSATGEVTFYNFTEDTIILRGEDTVLRYKDLRFQLKAGTLRIRPTAFIGLQGKKIDLTSLVTPQAVQAVELGEEFNLTSGITLDVINPKLNVAPTLLYAQNDGPFSGGSKKEVRVIDVADVETAARIIADRLSNNALDELSKSLKESEKIVQDKFEIKMLEQKIKPTLGSEAETFVISASARVSGLAYDRTLLNKLVKNKIKTSVPSGNVVDLEDQMLSFSLKDLDIVAGQAQIVNEFRATLHPDFGNSDFKYPLRGKSEAELKNYLKKQSMVKSVEVKFNPAWLPRASWLSGRIFIQME